MARKKVGGTKKTNQTHEMIDTKTEDFMDMSAVPSRSPMPMKKIALLVLLIGLVAILLSNKGLVVAAVVNGKPIFRWELNKVMTARFGQQTLEGMISESLIADEAKKAGVSVTKSDVDAKVQDVLAGLGGSVSLDDLLKYQGMTRTEFENQLKLQMTVEKMLGKDIVITDGDIKNFIATNSAMLTATDEAGLKEEAREAIMSQKINEKLQPWFLELKEKAKIMKFI